MPLYEYECEQCGATFEVIQKFSDHSVTVCRTCGGNVRRLLSAPAIQFKGTGWYITDYAKKNSPSASAKAGTKPGADSCSGEGAKAKSDKSSE